MATLARRRPEPQGTASELDAALERRIHDAWQALVQAPDSRSRRSLWERMVALKKQRRPEFVAALEAERLARILRGAP
jgi:hypothetical protein